MIEQKLKKEVGKNCQEKQMKVSNEQFVNVRKIMPEKRQFQ